MTFPIFPDGATYINPGLTFSRRDGKVRYDCGQGRIYQHDESDLDAFKGTIGQICALGLARQAEISRAFGVTKRLVLRAVQLWEKKGFRGFYAPRQTRGAAVLTDSVLAQAQDLLDDRQRVADVADQLGLKRNTVAKAVKDGRLRILAPQSAPPRPANSTPLTSKSQRSADDAEAPMGMGATDTLGRVAASLGGLGPAPADFQRAVDIPNGGVLLALPALLAMGLLRGTEERFKLSKGFYGLTSIFLLLAFMAQARLKSLERLRYCAPGEWGKLLGLDRVPEVRTLRGKVNQLSKGQTGEWSADLCKGWMQGYPEQATAFYVDGHVRVYHGDKALLPKSYVAREKLCLRASTDYWVNAMDGQPFFVVYQEIDPGLIGSLEEDIVPRLERDIPNQPSKDELEADPLLHRFTLIFDRAGYSPRLFRTLKEQRIACLTYRKCTANDWRETEFFSTKVKLVSGNVVEMRLAERGTLLGSKPDEQIWVREIRRLMPSGHQTSIVCTDYRSDLDRMAAAMFARWCQENFFKYMIENYGLDRMVSYQVENIPDTTQVVNPEHRRLDREVRSRSAILSRKTAEFGALELAIADNTDGPKREAQIQKRADILEEITGLKEESALLKTQRRDAGKHIPVSELPADQRLQKLSVGTKQLLDTIKLVAYRAETAMAHTLKEEMSRLDDARNLLRSIYTTEVDLLPEPNNDVLRVRLHSLANRSSDRAVAHLCKELNSTETIFPGTKLRLVYELVSGEGTTPCPEGGSA